MTITKILVEQGLYVLVRFPVSPWVFGRLKSIFLQSQFLFNIGSQNARRLTQDTINLYMIASIKEIIH